MAAYKHWGQKFSKATQVTLVKHALLLVILAGGAMETQYLAASTPTATQLTLDCPLQTFSDRDGNGSFETTRMACAWIPVQ